MSKSHLFLTLCLAICCSWSACSKDDEEFDEQRIKAYLQMDIPKSNVTPYWNNHPLPEGQRKLRVLAIGNSYTIDATAYVQDILNACDLDTATYSVYVASHSAATLRYWAEEALAGNRHEIVRFAGEKMAVTEGSLAELLAQDWDVITLQQFSGDAIHYNTFNPWLRRLIDFIHLNCRNQNVTLAWQMAWSYEEGFINNYSSYQRWLLIAKAVKDMTINDGVNVIIATGTAIQNARSTILNTIGEMTRDGSHLDFGIGRYVAACNWVQSLFAPVYGISVLGNEALPFRENDVEICYDSHPVTIDNRELAQRCAVAAVASPFAITTTEE